MSQKGFCLVWELRPCLGRNTNWFSLLTILFPQRVHDLEDLKDQTVLSQVVADLEYEGDLLQWLLKLIDRVEIIEKYLLRFLLGLHQSTVWEINLTTPQSGVRDGDQTTQLRAGRSDEKSLDVLNKDFLSLGKIWIPKDDKVRYNSLQWQGFNNKTVQARAYLQTVQCFPHQHTTTTHAVMFIKGKCQNRNKKKCYNI